MTAALLRAFKLSRAGYYLDFALAPLAVVALVVHAIGRWDARWRDAWLILAGIVLWELAEYLIHRYAFHGPLHALHDVHHRHPADYVGVGSWGTVAAFAASWLAVYGAASVATAHLITAGILIGYLGYIVIHDRMHHHRDRARFGRYLAFMFALHAAHHRGGYANFGVSSPLIDLLLGTYRSPR